MKPSAPTCATTIQRVRAIVEDSQTISIVAANSLLAHLAAVMPLRALKKGLKACLQSFWVLCRVLRRVQGLGSRFMCTPEYFS